MKKSSKKLSLSYLFIFLALCILTFTFLYPLWYMIINAMKMKAEYYMNKFTMPAAFNLSNFKWVIVDFNISGYFLSTIIVAGTSTLLIVFLSTFASYAFAKLRFPGKNIVYVCILTTIFLPSQISMIPAYVMFSKFNLINNYWSVILTYIAAGVPSAILLMRGTFMRISNEMIESAKIDGAGYFYIVKNIVFSMGRAAIAIVVIFSFIGHWNDLLIPMLYLTDVKKQTVMVGLTSLMQRSGSQPTHQLAGMVLSALPSILIYVVMQKSMIKGLTAGSIK